jgi:putative ABC transport system permease protein
LSQIIIIPGSVNAHGARLGFGSRHTLTEDDAHAIELDVPSVEIADPGMGRFGQVVAGNRNWFTELWGASQKHFELRGFKIAAGRPFSQSEIQSSSKVAVIGEIVARELFGDTDPIGQVIRINKVPVAVIGVLEPKGQTLMGREQDDAVFLPVTTLRDRIPGTAQVKRGTVGLISVKLREGASITEAEENIRALLRQRHRLLAGREDDFVVRNVSETLRAREESSYIMTLLLAAIASVSLLVGGIGIMNIMLVSVSERTREIGLRMAVGARARDILAQFLMEAVTLALTGGLLGVALGLAGSHAIGQFAGWPTALHVDSIALAVGFAGTIGIIFGYYPARQASRLTPIEALRYE